MKRLVFMGRSLEELRDFPDLAKHDAGYQLDRVQRGFDTAVRTNDRNNRKH